MNLRRNVVVGIGNSICTAVVGLLAIPLYLKYLGIENYGLIGFYGTTQALLQLLDMGLAPAMNRELARCSASGRIREARNLLRTLGIVYWLTAAAIAMVIFLLAPLIADQWLNARNLDRSTMLHAVGLMGLVVACRWPIGLYQGALIGMQRLTVSSTINMVSVVLGTLGSIGVLAHVSATVEAFFVWQAMVALAQAIVMRSAAWRFVGREGAGKFSLVALARIWRFSAGMSGIAISSILLMQIDKVLLSKMLSLEAFGHYVLAGVLASGLYVLLTPVFNVIYPRMSALVSGDETDKLLAFHKAGTRLLASVIFPISMTLAYFSYDVLVLWTGNKALSEQVAPIVSLLILGTSFNGVMHFPYALQLAYGKTSLALAITAILALCLVPMIIFLTRKYGAVGSATAWLALNVIYLVFGSWMTHRKLFRGKALAWLAHDVGMPLAMSAATVFLGWRFFHEPGHVYFNVFLACLLIPLAVLANVSALSGPLLKTLLRGGPGTTDGHPRQV